MVGHMKDTYHLAPLATWDPPHSLTESEEIFMSSLKCWHTHWINIFKTPRNILCRQGLLQGKRRLWSHVTRPQECLAALRLQTNSPTWSQVSFCSSGVSDAFLRMNPTPFIALTNWILMFLWWQTSEKCLVWLSKKGNILVYYNKVPQTEYLKPQISLLSKGSGGWRSRSRCLHCWFLPRAVKETWPFSLACRWPSSFCASSCHVPSMCVCFCVSIIPFYKDIVHTWLGVTLMTLF